MSTSPNVVGVHFKVGKKIGEGSFGVIYEGTDLLNNTSIAIKFESRKSEAPQLRDEFKTYKILERCEGIPKTYYFGQEGLHNILVIDLLGPSLEDLFDMCGRKFSIKTTCILAKAMIRRVWAVHEKSLIYRDIKPDNFLAGRPGTKNENLIYMVDFGMAKHYRDPRSKQHIPYRERKSLSGTARYMSINTHLGREQSRRDDLEALGHVFFYFLRGSLPWQGLKAQTNKQKYEKIGEKKQSTPVSELAEKCPFEFAEYLAYVRKLAFDEEPDYRYLINLFDKCMERLGILDDGYCDWMSTGQWQAACAAQRQEPAANIATHPAAPAAHSNATHNNATCQDPPSSFPILGLTSASNLPSSVPHDPSSVSYPYPSHLTTTPASSHLPPSAAGALPTSYKDPKLAALANTASHSFSSNSPMPLTSTVLPPTTSAASSSAVSPTAAPATGTAAANALKRTSNHAENAARPAAQGPARHPNTPAPRPAKKSFWRKCFCCFFVDDD